jgi:membrane associated rhomboid family serine protease
MFPLYDQSARSQRPPYFTIFLIVVNVAIFLFTFFSPNFDQIIQEYGTVPSQILKGQNLSTLLTSMFLHAGFMHLIGNMWFLWLFGDNVEINLGAFRFLIFYFLVGILAGLIHVFSVAPLEANLPTIGASGAISGLLGGYVVLFPRNKIRAFMMLYFRPIVFDVPAFFYVGVWFLYQLLYVGAPTSVAYMAHIGGFIAGMILIYLLKRKRKIKIYA